MGSGAAAVDFGVFEPLRTRVQITMFSLKTSNLGAYHLLSLLVYGTYINVPTYLLNIQKLSIFKTVII